MKSRGVAYWQSANPVPGKPREKIVYIGWSGKDWAIGRPAPAGNVFGAATGQLKWTFNPLPPEAVKKSGTADVWASISVDHKTGILYTPMSSPSPNHWGGNRKEQLPYGTSVTALNALTGKTWSGRGESNARP